MKKKIAVFVNSLEIGGTESVTLVFVNELIKYNFTVDLILLKKKRILSKIFRQES